VGQPTVQLGHYDVAYCVLPVEDPRALCHQSCIDFAESSLKSTDVQGKAVLEVGALDFNGSVRGIVQALGPESYVGVDLSPGPGVDVICDVRDLCDRFGSEAFDVVITTEMLEHVRDWKSAIRQLKCVVRRGGLLLVTTRSPGFPYHGYPHDFWRYTSDDFRHIFADFEIETLRDDPEAPGVFMRARRPSVVRTNTDADNVRLHSVILGRRAGDVSDDEIRVYLKRTGLGRSLRSGRRRLWAVVASALPSGFKDRLKRLLPERLWR
jgi:SAM-dependent methyltransferase